MKNAFLKDVLRDLRKSAGQLAGMLVIVAIGVFVFVGMGATGGMMYRVGEDYYRENNFYDLEVVSTFGLNDKDIKAIETVEGVAGAQGAYSMDALIRSGTAELNTKIHSIELGENRFRQFNPPTVLQGRYPEQGNEILVEQAVLDQLGLSLGDEVELTSGRSADIRTKLKTNRFRITGVAESPLYFSFHRGSSSVGSGEAEVYILIPSECFLQKIYNETFIAVEGARSLNTYSDEYDDLIQTVSDRVEAAGDMRIPMRKAEATRSAWVAVSKAQKELGRQKDEWTQNLLLGDKELVAGEREIRQGRADIFQAEAELADSFVILDAQEAALLQKLAQVNAGLDTLRAQEQSLKLGDYKLNRARDDLADGEEEYRTGKRKTLHASARLDKALATLAGDLGKIDAAISELSAGILALQDRQQALLDAPGKSEDSAAQEADAAQLAEVKIQLEQMEAQKAELETSRGELEAAAAQLLEMKPELKSAFQDLRRARSGLNAGHTNYQAGHSQYAITLKNLQGAMLQMEAQKAQIQSGLSEIDATRPQLEAAQQALTQNRWDLTHAYDVLEDSETALLLQKETGADEIAAAESAIRESRDALLEIDDPRWYVLNRYKNLGFDMYEGEAASMTDLGKLFPLVFFLVGALVSLTTMTRLVEEQRTVMGSYKAMGYSEGRIRAKYLFYAIVPSLLGALAGGLSGMVIFPNIVINSSYSSVFNIPDFDIVFNVPIMITGAVLAVISTTVPALITCRGALREVPASLMRPKAPSNGKKTPLEYISVLWQRLSFLYKVTFRNIFRYKQRLFMMLCGVGGSTALLLAGLGLNDSMSPVVDMQYKELFQYNMSVSFEDDTSSSSIQSTRKAIEANPLISRLTVLRQERMEAHLGDGDTRDALMTVAQNGEISDFILLRDRISGDAVPLGNEGALITEPLQKEWDLKAGSEIVLRDSDDEEFTVTVAGFCEGYTNNAVYLTPEYYQAASGGDYEINTVLIRQKDGVSPDALEAFRQNILDRNGVTSVLSMETQGKDLNDVLNSMRSITAVIIVISALMAFTILLNLTNINIVERKREIATIEVLGFRDKEVSAYVYRENMIVTFISSLVGIFLGNRLHIWLLESIEGNGIMFPRTLSVSSYLISVLATMLFAVAVALITSRKLKNIDMLGALKSIE